MARVSHQRLLHGGGIAQQLLGVHVAAVRGPGVQHRVRRVVQLQRHLPALRLYATIPCHMHRGCVAVR